MLDHCSIEAPVNLIAIDPGRTTGWATFKEKTLVEAMSGPFEDFMGLALRGPVKALSEVLVLIEMPRWYPHDHSDVNDLLDLSVKVGRIHQLYIEWFKWSKIDLVFPRTWKGTVKKEIMTERILGRLTPEELARVPLRPRAKTPDHNCVDAIGLGLWKLGRLR